MKKITFGIILITCFIGTCLSAIWAIYDFISSILLNDPFSLWPIKLTFLFGFGWALVLFINYINNQHLERKMMVARAKEAEKNEQCEGTEHGRYYSKTANRYYSIIAIILILSFSCKKPESKTMAPAPPPKTCYDINLLQKTAWKPIYFGYDAPYLDSTGQYYESGTLKGTWAFYCDCVRVSNPTIAANNFYFKIAKLSPETLEVYTARFGVTLFYK